MTTSLYHDFTKQCTCSMNPLWDISSSASLWISNIPTSAGWMMMFGPVLPHHGQRVMYQPAVNNVGVIERFVFSIIIVSCPADVVVSTFELLPQQRENMVETQHVKGPGFDSLWLYKSKRKRAPQKQTSDVARKRRPRFDSWTRQILES